jgi:HAD superfamily hydrolase (TIGR01459 family)
MLHPISGLKQISSLYTHFVLDVWGVVHDGNATYPGVIEAISFLRKEGKKVCFLSNAPRRASKVAAILQKFGITPDLYDFILTSGEATFLDLKKNQEEGFKNFGKKYFYIGPKKDIDLLDELDYIAVESAAEADVVITTGFDHEHSVLDEKLPQILEAKKHNLPMICVNPDMIVVRQDGHEMICAGALALEYEKIGGKVFYYGKPFSTVYKTVCEIFNNPENKKILAVGDGLETDIKGAGDFGIDSLLVTGGILANSLGIKYWQTADKTKLEKVCDSYQLFPKFVIPSLKL